MRRCHSPRVFERPTGGQKSARRRICPTESRVGFPAGSSAFRHRHSRALAALLILLPFVAFFRAPAHAGQTTGAAASGVEAPARQAAPEAWYRLRPGDTIEITFRFTPEFNQTAVIRPDGYLTLHDAGDVAAAGLTVAEFTRVVAAAYARTLRDPVLAVTLKDFERPYFLVGGEVQHPGKFELRTRITVREAVTIAGGLKPSGRESQVVLFRRDASGTAVRTIDMRRIFEGRLDDDLPLEPGDMLYVPRSVLAKIERFIPLPSLGFFVRPWD